MPTTSEYITAYVKAKEQGPRGFPGPPGPISGGVYPSAGVAVSTGAAWATSYTTSGSGTVLALAAGPTFTGTVTLGASTVIPDGGTIGQAAGPLLTFDDTNNHLEITGCKVGVNMAVGASTRYLQVNGGWYSNGNCSMDGDSAIFFTATSDAGRRIKIFTATSTGDAYFDYYDNLHFRSGVATSSDVILFTSTGSAGFGTLTPNAKIESLSTTEQLRLSYDSTHYTKFEVASTGALTITPLANTNLNITCSGTGDFAVNTNDLYVDSSSGYVGVNTTSPLAWLNSLATTEQLRLSYDATHYTKFEVNSTGKLLVTPIAGTDFSITVSGAGKFQVTGKANISSDTGVDGILNNSAFSSGFGGNNWQIHTTGAAEFESILCRGALNVYELIINRMHYQNGGLIIGPGAGKVATVVDATLGAEVLTFHDPNGAAVVPFTVGAIVMIQNVDINRTSVVKKIVREVASIAGMEVTFKATAGWVPAVSDVGSPNIYDEMVTIGHVSTASLQNSIFMTATETNNPYLAVFTEVDSYGDWLSNSRLKLMIGNLAKIASATYGDLMLPASPGYGFFSDNCYLSGKIVASSGLIGGFTIESDKLSTTLGTGYISYIDEDGVFSWAHMNSYCYSQQSTPVTLTAPVYYVVALDHDAESTLNLPSASLPGSGESTSMIIIHAEGTGLGAGKYHINGNGYKVNRGGTQANSFDLDEGEAVLVVWDPRQGGQWYAIG